MNVETIRQFKPSELRPNPANPRGEVDAASVADLVQSVASVGVIQPLVVTPARVIVVGHRRHAAALLAGLATVPAIVREIAPAEQLAIMTAENVSREDLSPLQEARAYRAMAEAGLAYAEIARRVGVRVGRVADRVALFDLDEATAGRVDRGELPLGAVRVLLRVDDVDRRRQIADAIADRKVTLRVAERMATRAERGDSGGALTPREIRSEIRADVAAVANTTRSAALHELVVHASRYASFRVFNEVAEAVCHDCGAHKSTPVTCRECPLPRVVAGVVKATEKVRRVAG